MTVTNDIKFVGVNDHELDLFEGEYIIPNGIAYNSYVIIDEKIAVTDSVDGNFGEEWLSNIEKATGGKAPDYLVVHHMEPDHSRNIVTFMDRYPEAKMVSSAKAFVMLTQFYDVDYSDRKVEVKEGDVLELGRHSLRFIGAPMVHWPEVLVSYDECDKVLFSADAFGKFGAHDCDEDWACEARRYYFGIVGKYGVQVQALLKKASALDIQIICPLHGPVLSENLGYYLDLYNTWSSYGVESEGINIAYTSVYGNTKKAVELLADMLREKGCPKVAVNDLAREDMAECVEDAFRYGKLILATTTYNNEIFPYMHTFLNKLAERNIQNKTIGLVENGSWAPAAAKKMKAMLENSKVDFTDTVVTIKSALKDDSKAALEALADEILKA